VPDETQRQQSATTESGVTDSGPEASSEELIELPPGTDLTPESGALVTAASLTRVVLIAGEAESGKTTLLSTIYEKFNEAPFANLLFAGSSTLVGWEQRCHLSRVASGAEKAETERTQGLRQRLLHLRVREQELNVPVQDILFTDLSGEVFRLIRDSTSECQQLGMLKRADHIVLMLDGKKIATALRHEALNNGMALLRSCVDAGMVGLHSFVDVVISKYDLVTAGGQGTAEFIQFARERITSRFESKLGRLRFHNVAARPQLESGIDFGFGIADLLSAWVQDSPYFVSRLACEAELPTTSTEFDSYLRVRFPALKEIRAWS
jgi:hypothetical protein